MTYTRNGLYDFVREEKISLSENFDEREDNLASLVNFFKLEGIFVIFGY